MSEEALHWYWNKRFENIQLLTVDDILDLTIERGQEIEKLLLCLDQNAFSGILSDVTINFLDLKVKKLLPKQILNDSQFETVILNSKMHFNTEDEDKLRCYCVKFYSHIVNGESPEYEKRAMIAFIELGLKNYELSLHSAGFAINEQEIVNFGDELVNKRSLLAQNALVSTATDLAKILLTSAHSIQAQNN